MTIQLTRMSLKKVILVIVPLWVLIQVILIVHYWNYPLTGDTIIYNSLAEDCFAKGLWYPYDSKGIIVAEPLVNSLILLLKLFGTLEVNKILNLLMNIGVLWSVYEIAKSLFDKTTAFLSVIIFCLIYSNTVIIIGNRTELPFVLFLLMALATIKPKLQNVIISGIMMGIAEWYRPLMPVFIPGLLLYMWYEKYEKKYYLGLFFSIALSIGCIGLFNKYNTDVFFINPSTGGANLFMTANDKAFGGTATHLLQDPDVVPVMPANYNALQQDSVYKELAKEWIREHPVKYTELYIKKIFGLYIEDSWPDRAIMHSSGKLSKHVTDKDYVSLLHMASLMILKSIVYYLTLLLFVISIVNHRKKLFTSKGSLVLTFLLGTLTTCVFVVSPTYHYPYMFAIIIWAAYEIKCRYLHID